MRLLAKPELEAPTKMIKGPAIFLAQFASETPPFNSFCVDLRMGRFARLSGRADPERMRGYST